MPPAAVSVRISTGEIHGFGTSAPLSARASSLQRRAGGSAVTRKLIQLIGPASTLFAKELSPCFAQSAVASSVRLRVLGLMTRLPPWRDVVAELHAQGPLNADLSISSSPYIRSTFHLVDRNGSSFDSAVYRTFIQSFDTCPPSWVDQAQIHLDRERGHCPRGQACPCFVACQGNLDVKDTSLLVHPRQRKG